MSTPKEKRYDMYILKVNTPEGERFYGPFKTTEGASVVGTLRDWGTTNPSPWSIEPLLPVEGLKP